MHIDEEFLQKHVHILHEFIKDLEELSNKPEHVFASLMASSFSLMRVGLSLCNGVESLKYQLEAVEQKLEDLKKNLMNEINQKEKSC